MAPVSGATMLVICAGNSAETIWLDADGTPINPDAPTHKCPDCRAFSAPAAATDLPLVVPMALAIPVRLGRPVDLRPEPVAHLRPDPRAPPAAPIEDRRAGDLRHFVRSLHLAAPDLLASYQADPAALVTDLRATLQRRPA